MASGFPGRDLYGNMMGAEDGGRVLMKRPRTEMERLQKQQQLQHALFLRSVKQKIHQSSPISPISPLDLYSSSSSPIISPPPPPIYASFSTGYGFGTSLARQRYPGSSAGLLYAPPLQGGEYEPAMEKKSSAMRDQLEELERSLLGDEEDEDEASASTSAVTTAEYSEAMHQLIASSVEKPLSPSPTTSLSSSSSCTAAPSSSPPPSTAQLRNLLLEAANAVSDGNLEAANAGLCQLKRAANPRGDPEQRLTAIMVSALISRLNPPPPSTGSQPHPIAELCSGENVAATQLLHDISPCFKLGLMAANYAILEATKDHSKIHIIDFDVGHGGQYASLIHAIAEQRRHNPTARPPVVKITAVTDPTLPFNALSTTGNKDSLKTVGERVAVLAERAGVGLLFNIVCRRTAELDRATLGCEPGEALAVNFAFMLSRVADESVSPANPRDELLRRVKDLGPRVVTLVEQQMNSNTAPFAARFADACAHYGAVIESLEATMGRESGERARVEGCLARKAANLVAQEGPDRVERCEVFGKWRSRMGMAGFKQVPLGPAVAEPIRIRLSSLRSNPGFTLKEEAGGLCFGWVGRVLTVASSWRLPEA